MKKGTENFFFLKKGKKKSHILLLSFMILQKVNGIFFLPKIQFFSNVQKRKKKDNFRFQKC